MTALLDANALIALLVRDHVHHEVVEAWWRAGDGPFATTPSTQGSLLRFLVREGQAIATATAVLAAVTRHPRHRFWLDALPYTDVNLTGVTGHRQVTDAYLAAVARAQRGAVVTLDRGFASSHADVAMLLRPA